MPRDLTASPVDRQNILNNPYAVGEIQKAAQIRGVVFEGAPRVIKEQVAAFFEVDPRTIERCLEQNADELLQNGYEVIRGKRLQEFKLAMERQFVTDIDVGHKVVNLVIFDFRAFLNIGMLLTDSQRARLLRQLVLDIVFDVINQRTGGGTKYINQRDEDFLQVWFQGENYRKQFTDALRDSAFEDSIPRFSLCQIRAEAMTLQAVSRRGPLCRNSQTEGIMFTKGVCAQTTR